MTHPLFLENAIGKKPDDMQRELMLRRLQIDSLLEVTNAINSNYTANELFNIYDFILRAQMQVKRLVMFYRKNNKQWHCERRYGIADDIVENIRIEDLLQFKDTTSVSPYDPPILQHFQLVMPVYHKEEPLAFVLLGDIEPDNNIGSLDDRSKFIRTITNIIVVAIENKRLFKQQIEQEKLRKELELAERVQSMLIPKQLPYNDSLQMNAIYMPHSNIGGDYYDYIPLSSDEFLVCMADISGKGIAAALLMANIQAILRALAKETPNLAEIVYKLNDRVREITNSDKYITIFLAHHHLPSRQMSYINCGHQPPLMQLPSGEITPLEAQCTILGIFEKIDISVPSQLHTPAGTRLLTYTDGLTDLENSQGDFWGIEQLIHFLQTQPLEIPIEVFNRHLLETAAAFKGETLYTDDISILSYQLM